MLYLVHVSLAVLRECAAPDGNAIKDISAYNRRTAKTNFGRTD